MYNIFIEVILCYSYLNCKNWNNIFICSFIYIYIFTWKWKYILYTVRKYCIYKYVILFYFSFPNIFH